MSDISEPEDEIEKADENEGDPLTGWSRFAAGLAGLSLSGAGVTAVFVTTNQAGSVALILGGVVFLLMLISGNPLLSFGHGDTQMKFATRRRRERVLEEANEAPPREARRVLDMLRAVDPGVSNDTAFIRTSAYVYEQLIGAELARIFPEYHVAGQRNDIGADFRIVTPSGRSAAIEVKYLSRQGAVSTAYVRQLIGMASVSSEGHLLVSNQRLTRAAVDLMSDARGQGIKVEFSQWRDDQDDSGLREAMNTLLHAE